jgi:hypothetical protein
MSRGFARWRDMARKRPRDVIRGYRFERKMDAQVAMGARPRVAVLLSGRSNGVACDCIDALVFSD